MRRLHARSRSDSTYAHGATVERLRTGREGKGRGREKRVPGHAYNLTVGAPLEAPCMGAYGAQIGGQTCP